MSEMELISKGITKNDNTINVEMSNDEIWFLKNFIKNYNPQKIVEIGISAGGNTVNLLNWKNKDAKLFSIDISTQWYKDRTKLSGYMADDLVNKDNWKIYRGYDYLDVCEEIGNDIDLIIIDTVHTLPGEFLTFLVALPQLKDGCIVILHDIHLNMMGFSNNAFGKYNIAAYCNGLLFGSVSSNNKWTLKSDISNIGAFVIDQNTKRNIKDIFHVLCATWHNFPSELNLEKYSEFINKNYPRDCYNLFNACLKLQSKYFNYKCKNTLPSARVDIFNSNNKNNSIEILNVSDYVDVQFPGWFRTEKGNGAVIQTSVGSFDLKLKCINAGLLDITLRGPDVRDELGNPVPMFVDFKTFKINDEDIIKENITVWRDIPYNFEKIVTDGEIIEFHFEWIPSKSSITN